MSRYRVLFFRHTSMISTILVSLIALSQQECIASFYVGKVDMNK